MNLDSPFWGNRVHSCAACAVVYAPKWRWLTDGQGDRTGKKGVHTVDTLDVDEKGASNVRTLGGTQQMTVQHVPDEWKGSARIATPGVDDMGHNGCDPPPTRPQF